MDESERNTAVEDVPTNTLHGDRQTAETHQGEGQSQPFESHLGDETEIPRAENEKDTCTCSEVPTVNTGQRATSEQTHCPLCGKLTRQSSETLSPSETGQAFADGLHFTPSTAEAFQDGNNQSTMPSTKNTTAQNDPAADEAGGCKKKAVEGLMSPTTVQVPSRDRRWTLFTLVENHPALNEKWFSIYIFPSQRYEDETYQTMEDFQRSFDFTNVVPSAREDQNTGLERSQHFHNIFMEGHAHLTITFRLLERWPGSFRMRVVQTADRILTATTLSRSQGRFPSPTGRVIVEHLGAPGELHQGEIIMTIDYGERVTHIIPIWFIGQP